MVRVGSALSHWLACLAFATILPAAVAGPELPEYHTPGERPPMVMKMYFGARPLRKSPCNNASDVLTSCVPPRQVLLCCTIMI